MDATTMFVVSLFAAGALCGWLVSAIFWRAREIVIAIQKVEAKIEELGFGIERCEEKLSLIESNTERTIPYSAHEYDEEPAA
jgi:uncharacterized membrane protein YciS (DUF1049 family)